MDKIGKVSSIQFELFGRLIELNPNMLLMTYIVIAFFAISAFLERVNFKEFLGTHKIFLRFYTSLLKR